MTKQLVPTVIETKNYFKIHAYDDLNPAAQ